MTKIALISDSHGSKDRLKEALENINKSRIRHVIHAGDFAVYGVEKIFAAFPNMTFYIARGNCDVNEEILEQVKNLPNCHLSNVISFKMSDIRIAASHIEGQAESVLKKEADIFCHGHTHRQKIEKREDFFVLNPGALCEEGIYYIIEVPDLMVEKKMWNEQY